MADPWCNTCSVISTDQLDKFEDNFVNPGILPDSQEYLKNLEAKLEKLKNSRKLNKKDLINSLSQTKQSHLERLINSDNAFSSNDIDLDQPIQSTNLSRLIAPEKQANTLSELLELLQYDQLGKLFEEFENNNDVRINPE